jgi:hypothetical protein
MESLQSPPTKRRALAALDANAMSSPRHGATALHDKLAIPASVSSASVAAAPGSPRKTDLAAAAAARKRALEDVADANAPPTPTSANKRTCVEVKDPKKALLSPNCLGLD